MKGESAKRLRLTERLVWIGIALAVLSWIIESALHLVIFHPHEDGLIHQIFRPEAHEAWMRLLVASMFIAFGIYAQFLITQRRKAEAATKLAHAELNQIFQTAADGMRLVDKDYNVLRVNKTFAALTGVSKEDAVGKKCYDVFRGPLCHTPRCPLTKIIAGEERVDYDAHKECMNGKKVPCIVTATAFRGPGGELIGIVEDFKDITERKQVEEALRESERRLRHLSSQLLTVQEEERKRLSAELHDELGQALILVKINLRGIQRALGTDQAELKGECEDLIAYIKEVSENVRRLSRDLSPAILEDVGFLAALRRLVEGFAKHSNIETSLEMANIEDLLPKEAQIIAYRIVQECFTNVARHAQATNVSFEIGQQDDQLIFCVEDDGVGFNVEGVLDADSMEKGLGLPAMFERARMLGGSLDIRSQQGEGTIVTCRIPIDNGGG